jgi:DNA-binding GntR family transcriptional regulator
VKLTPTSGHPYQALAAALLAKIRGGDLKPDDQLPTIRALAKEYDVTIATAQRAVQQLALDGHVQTVPNLGSFVRPFDNAPTEQAAGDVLSERVDELQIVLARLDERVRRLEEGPAGEGECLH